MKAPTRARVVYSARFNTGAPGAAPNGDGPAHGHRLDRMLCPQGGMTMKALLRHELQASRVSRPKSALIIGGVTLGLIWLFFSAWRQPGVLYPGVLYAAAVGEMAMLCQAFGLSVRGVAREWENRTGHLWLRLRPSAWERLAAKGLAALCRAVVWYALAAAVGLAVLVLSRANLSSQGLALLVGHQHTAAGAAAFVVRWLVPDLALVFAIAPPLAALGLGCGLIAHQPVAWVPGRVRISTTIVWTGGLVVFWDAALRILPQPLLRLAQRGQSLSVHFTPVGRADVMANVLPHVAVTLWPLIGLWCLGAVVFALSIHHLGARLARG